MEYFLAYSGAGGHHGNEVVDQEFVQPPDHAVGALQGVGQVRGGDADNLHAGGQPGLDADLGVLENDASVRGEPEPLRGQQKYLRMRFPVRHVLGGHDIPEKSAEIDSIQHAGDVQSRRGRGHGAGDGIVLQPVQKSFHPGQRGHPFLAHDLAIQRRLPVRDRPDFRGIVGPSKNFGDDALALHPERFFEITVGQGPVEFRGQQFPAAQMVRLGVDNDTVPVENDAP